MIRITWFGKSTPYSAKIAQMAFLLAFAHFDFYILMEMVSKRSKETNPDVFISIASFMLLGMLLAASKAERKMFLPKNFKVAGILAQGYWCTLLVFHVYVCINPNLYLSFFPDLLDFRWQSFLLYVPAVLFGILELTLGNKYFRKQDWEPVSDQPSSQSNTTQVHTL